MIPEAVLAKYLRSLQRVMEGFSAEIVRMKLCLTGAKCLWEANSNSYYLDMGAKNSEEKHAEKA